MPCVCGPTPWSSRSTSTFSALPGYCPSPMALEDMASLARAWETSQAEAQVELSDESRPLAGGVLAFGGAGAFVNKATGLGMTGPVPEETGEEVRAFFTARGVQPRAEVCTYVHPSLLESLGRAGFRLEEFENVFTLSLSTPVEEGPPPRGLHLERVDVQDEAAVELYVRLSTSGFFTLGQQPSSGFLRAARRAVQLPGYDCYLARLDDEAVAAAGCSTRRGATALFGASVLPAHRGQGIHRALLLARLRRAQQLHSRLATVASHPGQPTERNALRLGFQLAFIRMALLHPSGPLGSAP
jgi:GNAT superfamily N-acetyltransferase